MIKKISLFVLIAWFTVGTVFAVTLVEIHGGLIDSTLWQIMALTDKSRIHVFRNFLETFRIDLDDVAQGNVTLNAAELQALQQEYLDAKAALVDGYEGNQDVMDLHDTLP